MRSERLRRLAFFVSAGLVFSPVAAADVPAMTVVKIVMAAIAYDGSIESRFGEAIDLRLVGDGPRADALADALGQLVDKKLQGRPLRFARGSFDGIVAQGADVVFFADGLGGQASARAATCAEKRWTCVAAVRGDVAQGIPLGVALRADGRPVLMLNPDAARNAGMNLPASVAQVAEIVRR